MNNIKNFDTVQEYNLEPKPTTESVVSHINEGNQMKYDGINVEVSIPKVGDAVYHDGSRVRFYDGNTLNDSLLTAAGLTPVGACGGLIDGKALIIDGEEADRKYADIVQFRTAVPTETGTLSLGARFISNDETTTITVEYTAGMTLATAVNTYEENDTTLCGRINTALAALDGITGTWWAYLNDEGEVILQRDTWTDYRQYNRSGALTHVTWGDMPATDVRGFRINGRTGNEGIMNVARGAAYYGTDGRTPTVDVPLNAALGIVKKTDFETSAYCSLLRQTYGTYENYIKQEYTLLYPQKLGVFNLPRAEELSAKYATLTAPMKDGTAKAKFPALYYGATKNYSVTGIALGDWFLHGVHEGTMMMIDEARTKINATFSKMGKTLISNSSSRWFAQRYNVNYAWYFYGTYGSLTNHNVYSSRRARAVALLEIEN